MGNREHEVARKALSEPEMSLTPFGGTILLVDDDPDIREVLRDRLESLKYRVFTTSNGVEALALLSEQPADLILLDVEMPKMNGIEMLERLRKDERYRGTPVILLTVRGSQDDKVNGLDAGATDYVAKPFDTLELLARVRAMMRIKETHDSLGQWNRLLEGKVSRLADENQRMSRFKRYLSPQIADAILESDESVLATHRREITAVFIDLRGFTTFCNHVEPEEVLALLKSYHEEMGRLIVKFEGTLERFVGDGIMVLFNDPVPCEDHTKRAVEMALEMRARAKELRAGWLKQGYDLDLGVGIAEGYATLGSLGYEGRLDYSAVGSVNILAFRLSEAAKGGQILTNQKTLLRIEDLVHAEPLEERNLKGFDRPVVPFNIVSLKHSPTE